MKVTGLRFVDSVSYAGEVTSVSTLGGLQATAVAIVPGRVEANGAVLPCPDGKTSHGLLVTRRYQRDGREATEVVLVPWSNVKTVLVAE